jgi:mRNA-degrading endonuclease RelE of RelBE toxin-antitoxin system
MSFEIRTIAHFDRELKALAKKYHTIKDDLQKLSTLLAEEPLQGTPIGKDCYKIRISIASKGKGKSGGGRVIACVKVVNEVVTLLSIYDKSAQSDINDVFLTALLKENDLI